MKTSVNWPPELVRRVKEAAEADRRSVSQFTALLVEAALNKDSKDASDTQDE